MIRSVTGIWREVSNVLRKGIGQVFTTHLAYVAFGVILFAPLVGITGQFLLHLSGQPVLADQDILYFFLTPFGIFALILFTALLITIFAFEQASMMAISAGTTQGLHVGTVQALYFTARRSVSIFSYSIRLVMRVLTITLPFLAVGGVVAWVLITKYDINYYLTEKPPEFLAAAAFIALLLLAMVILLVRKLMAWSLSLPLVLFAGTPPARSFADSENLIQGQKKLLFVGLGIWALAAFLLSVVVLFSVQFFGSKLAPLFYDSISLLVFVLGGLAALLTLGNVLVTTFASGSFACLLMIFYKRYGLDIRTGELADSRESQLWRITAPRLVLVVIGCTATALLVGTWLLSGIQTHDNVLVMAHRGAAGKAPENTLASIRQAMEDEADWIEIDVQESADGEIVVIHDSDFMKLAGVDLKVWNGTLQQLQEIDVGSWFGTEFSAERVPTLSQVLEEARGRSNVVIELKYYGHDQQLEQRVIDIVEQTGTVDDVAIMSLKYDGISKVQALRPDWVTGLLSATAIGDLVKLDVDFLAVNMNMATPGFIRRAQTAGKKVFVWTVNDQVSMTRMMSLGVDGIITDEPEMARKVLADRAELSSIERLLIHVAVMLGQPVPEKTYRDQSP